MPDSNNNPMKSSLSRKAPSASYANSIIGTLGTFKTTAGEVGFLETKARLEKAGLSSEFRLTSFLTPVREALPVQGMSFNQLLQRDLDDHRVAVDLIPYLLRPNLAGPAFFPPVVAVLLPFHGDDEPQERFPEALGGQIREDDIGMWLQVEVPNYYRVDKLVYENGETHDIRAGRLAWNSERAKLIVIDGQHRAMALIGIDRTINNKWASGRGEKYRSFYEGPVNNCLEGLTPSERDDLFQSIELPVTVTWFPTLKSSHQVAARKVFVDLNKNARKPSESRILLLSDTNLISVFTRATLNKFREAPTSFPIYAVEYDHPENEQASQSKWSVVSNVTVIADCIRRLIEGPEKFFSMSSSFGGNESDSQRGELLRKSLDVSQILPAIIEEEDMRYEREKLDAKNFPRSSIDQLESQYLDHWGTLLTHFFSKLGPYKYHAQALSELKVGWTTSNAASGLARDAIFEGVGIYWTLRASETYRQDLVRQEQVTGQPAPARTDVHEAWRIIQDKRATFIQTRSKLFLGKESLVQSSEAAYAMFSTAACQLGFVLAARALAAMLTFPFSKVAEFCEAVVLAADASLQADRQLVFVKDPDVIKRGTFNLLGSLDTPKAVYFRYMWMELLGTPEGREKLKSFECESILNDLIADGRFQYRNFLIDDFKKSLKRQHPEKTPSSLLTDATAMADKQLYAGLKRWFKVNENDYENWVSIRGVPVEAESTIDVESGELSSNLVVEGSSNEATDQDEAQDLDSLIYASKSDE